MPRFRLLARRFGFSSLAIGFAVAACLVPAVAHAQTVTGQITGRVTDSSSGVLPGVSITVTNTDTGLVVERVTDETGQYVATNLPVGPYTVEANLAGFRKVQRTGIQLGADGRISADFSLAAGGVSENVELHRPGEDPDVEFLRGARAQLRRVHQCRHQNGTNRLAGTGRFDYRDESLDKPNYFAARDAQGNRTKPALEFRHVEAAA